MPKISDEQRTAARQKLIDATLAVVERDGADALTTRAITTEAGVSAGMFYGHFDSKEALLAAVVDHKVDELTTLVQAELDLGSRVDDVATELLHRLIAVLDLRALASFRSIPTTDESTADQQRINDRIVAAFTPLLDLAIDNGVVDPAIDVRAVIEFIDLVIDAVNRRRMTGFVTSHTRVTDVALAAVEQFLLTPSGASS